MYGHPLLSTHKHNQDTLKYNIYSSFHKISYRMDEANISVNVIQICLNITENGLLIIML